MDTQLLQYFIGAAITGAVALLWRIDRTLARQGDGLIRVTKAFGDHEERDREDFRRLTDHIDSVRAEQLRVAADMRSTP